MVELPTDDDMKAVFRAMDERSKEKRAENRDNALEILTEAGISFSSHNDGAHLIVTGKHESFDFWPGTGRWMSRSGGKLGASFGIFNLIKRLKGE